jgi:hypothetical protein
MFFFPIKLMTKTLSGHFVFLIVIHSFTISPIEKSRLRCFMLFDDAHSLRVQKHES